MVFLKSLEIIQKTHEISRISWMVSLIGSVAEIIEFTRNSTGLSLGNLVDGLPGA